MISIFIYFNRVYLCVTTYIFLLDDYNNEKVKNRKIEKALYRILSGIQVSWAEESIKRLLYEKRLFTDVQRKYLLERPSLEQRWYATLKIVFSIAYELIPSNDETCKNLSIENERNNLGDELVDHYIEMKRIVTDYLSPNFSIRNKVQHGEWEYAFKPKYSAEFSQEITDKLNHENIITTTSRFTLINAFYQMIVDLGRFKSNSFAIDSILTPFEYYYQNYINKITFEVNKINNPQLDDFIKKFLERKIKGKKMEQENKKIAEQSYNAHLLHFSDCHFCPGARRNGNLGKTNLE